MGRNPGMEGAFTGAQPPTIHTEKLLDVKMGQSGRAATDGYNFAQCTKPTADGSAEGNVKGVHRLAELFRSSQLTL